MADGKHPPTIEQQESPIYYCWKYWTSDGEIREGCTPIQPSNHETWLDLNEYGWVYVAVPVAIIFVIVFLIYIICSNTGSNNYSQKNAILIEESESEDELPSPESKQHRVQSYHPPETQYYAPQNANRVGGLATMVPMSQLEKLSARKTSPKGHAPPFMNRFMKGTSYAQTVLRSSAVPHKETALANDGPGVSAYLSKNTSEMASLPDIATEKMKADRHAPTAPAEDVEESSSDGGRASNALLLNRQETEKQARI